MKHLIIAFFTLHFSLFILTAFAAVPVPWTVDMKRAQPATFEAYQGETLDFQASLTLDGKPFEAPSNYSFFWQTNGMGRYYWEAPSNSNTLNSNNSNTLFATWLPSYDVGARVYNCFIGSPSNNYHTAFQLRLRPSPGATPNALPLPVPVIDFAKVRVLNPPWGAGVDTNAVIDIIHKTVDGAARPLPKYLWLYEADDSYPEEAAAYYRSRGDGKVDGGCSSVRTGGFLSRNFDFPFDDRAEFVVKMSAGKDRFASVGVAQVGTNLTEEIVTSGKPEYSARYKWLPGATVDGINEHGVACNINVVNGDPQTSGWHTNETSEAIHPLAAVRWILDHATNAQHGAECIAANIRFPQDWSQNYHYMVADERETWIVENGGAHKVGEPAVMTNFSLYPDYDGMGWERFRLLALGANITNAWYTRAYRLETNPPWVSDLREVLAYTNDIFDAWAAHPKEYFRNQLNGGQPWWQSIHTSIYDLTNRTLRVAVQEQDDWYVFAVPGGTGVSPDQARAIAEDVASSKLDKTDVIDPLTATTNGPAADAKATADALDDKLDADADYFGGISSGSESLVRFIEGQELVPQIYYNGFYWEVIDQYYENGFALEPAPDISGKADRDELTASTNEVIHVIKDAAKNLKYTITGDNGRFYMTPIGAINPED